MNYRSRAGLGGPLDSYFQGLQADLVGSGYAPSTVGSHLALWAQLSRWLVDRGLGLQQLSSARIEQFLAVRAQSHRYLYSAKALAPGLDFLRRQGALPTIETAEPATTIGLIEAQFRSYLLVERGLAEVSAETYVARARPFLMRQIQSGSLDLQSLTPGDVSSFAADWLPGLSKAPAKSTVTALRSLLSFLHATGLVALPLASVVPPVASWRLTGLPIGLDRAHIDALLDGCDQATPVGRRDFAIVSVLVRLGLRAAEVAALTLDDINWRAGTLMVHGKGSRHEQLPLPVDVGSALSSYLRHRRPPPDSTVRAVFLRVKAPNRALAPGSISTMVARVAARSGLGTVHAHLLRHTLATRVLGAGASLDEVGQLLRHRSRASTAIYAKVDRRRLAELARPWPVQAGAR